MSALHAAPPRLSTDERAAESVYALMRAGELSKVEFVRRMRALEQASPISACYATYLLLRRARPSSEKARHWETMVGRLRDALNDSASLR